MAEAGKLLKRMAVFCRRVVQVIGIGAGHQSWAPGRGPTFATPALRRQSVCSAKAVRRKRYLKVLVSGDLCAVRRQAGIHDLLSGVIYFLRRASRGRNVVVCQSEEGPFYLKMQEKLCDHLRG